MNEDNKYIHILSQPTITPSMNDGKTMEEEIQSYKKIIKKIKEWENYKQGISKPIISMAITNMLYFFQVHSVAKYESNEDFIVKALILHTMKVESSRKEYFRLNQKIAQKEVKSIEKIIDCTLLMKNNNNIFISPITKMIIDAQAEVDKLKTKYNTSMKLENDFQTKPRVGTTYQPPKPNVIAIEYRIAEEKNKEMASAPAESTNNKKANDLFKSSKLPSYAKQRQADPFSIKPYSICSVTDCGILIKSTKQYHEHIKMHGGRMQIPTELSNSRNSFTSHPKPIPGMTPAPRNLALCQTSMESQNSQTVQQQELPVAFPPTAMEKSTRKLIPSHEHVATLQQDISKVTPNKKRKATIYTPTSKAKRQKTGVPKKCPKCTKSFKTIMGLEDHLEYKHMNCSICSKSFNTVEETTTHRRQCQQSNELTHTKNTSYHNNYKPP